jgi:hypothetical protein
MSLASLNIAPLSSKQPAFVSLSGTYVTWPRPIGPAAGVLQLDVFLLQMQFVNVQIFVVINVWV